MKKKTHVKSISIISATILVFCAFSSIVTYANVTKSDYHINVLIEHIPRFPVLEEEITFFVHLTGLQPNTGKIDITCKLYSNGIEGNLLYEGNFYDVETRELNFTISDVTFNESGEFYPRLVVTDNTNDGGGSNGEKLCVGEEVERDIIIDPEIQEPRVPILFSTDELFYDGCRWIFDDNNPPTAIVNDDFWYHPIELGVSGLDEERVYNGRFVEADISEEGDTFYVTKFSYEIKNHLPLTGDYDKVISNIVYDKDKEDNFLSDGKSFISLFNELFDEDIINSLFSDVSGNNIAEEINTIFSMQSDFNTRKDAVENIHNKMNNLKSDFDFDQVENIFNYLKENEIENIEDIPLGTEPFLIPDWADEYINHDLPWIDEDETDLSGKEVIEQGIEYYKNELAGHVDSDTKLSKLFDYVSDGLDVDIITIIIWFVMIFILSVVVVETIPLVATLIALADALILSIITVFLLDNAGFQEGIDDLISKIPLPYGLSEMDWEGVVSIVIFVLVFGSFFGVCSLYHIIGTIVSSLTIVGIAASVYVLVPMIKDKLDFEDGSSKPVPVPFKDRPFLNFILTWFFDRNPDSFPLFRRIFGF